MPNRFVWFFAIAITGLLLGFGGLRASDEANGPNKPGERCPPPGAVLKFILAHAQELSLTDEQKEKFETILKEHQGERPRPDVPKGERLQRLDGEGGGPGGGVLTGVLTQEQREKLRELVKAELQDRQHEQGDRRPLLARIHEFILAHAQELNLTDEQKQKLETILKEHQGERPRADLPDGERPQRLGGENGNAPGEGPFAVLTQEQREKLRELLKAEAATRHPGDAAKLQK